MIDTPIQKEKKHKKMIVLNDRLKEMIEMIRGQIGAQSDSAVIYRGIEELYGSLFPAYKFGAGGKMPKVDEENAIKLAGIKAKGKIEEKRIQEEARWAPKIDMCENMLHGTVETHGNNRFCIFKMHTPTESVTQQIPLAQVDPIVAETSLFSPDRDTVLASREDLRAEFAE